MQCTRFLFLGCSLRMPRAPRQAALVVTERSEGRAPLPGEEILGANACDVVFSASSSMGAAPAAFDLARLLGRSNTFRMTTFADVDMIHSHLVSMYGDHKWPRPVLEEMRVRVHEDLNGAYVRRAAQRAAPVHAWRCAPLRLAPLLLARWCLRCTAFFCCCC